MPSPLLNFAQSPTGNLYMSDGFRPVKFWDGLSTNFETAGIAAPTTGVLTATASSTGDITGSTYLYQRFVDRHGQPSNAVPGSSATQPFFASNGTGSITNVTNTSPLTVTTSAAHGLSTGDIVFISGVGGATTANGKWGITVTSTTEFQLTSSFDQTISPPANVSSVSTIIGTAVDSGVAGYDHIYPLWITVTSPTFISLLTVNVSKVSFSGTNAVFQLTGGSTYNLDSVGPWTVKAISGTSFRISSSPGISVQKSYYTYGDVTFSTTGSVTVQSLNTSVIGGTYTGGGTWLRGAGQINYANLGAAPTQAVKRQILRTKNGDTSSMWIDIDEDDEDDTSLSSTNTDNDLITDVPFTDLAGNDLALNRFGEPPTTKPYLVHHNGRLLGWGFPIWNQGRVAVTNASDSVVGQNTGWTSDMDLVGRRLYVSGASESYEIESFDATTQTITLTEAYADTTDTSVTYAILPDSGGSRRTFEWSDAEYPSAWDPTDSLAVPEDAIAGEASGVTVLDRISYLASENRLWIVAFSTAPDDDGSQRFGPQRGLVNNRCAVTVEGVIYLLDRQGVYRLQGNSVDPVSTAIHDLFDPERAGDHKINFRWQRYFHAAHDQEHETIRWYVSMSGRYPRHAICYQYRLDRWWIEEYPMAIASSTVGVLGNRRQVFLGGEGRTVWAQGHGHLDGITKGSGTTRGTVQSAGLNWFTCSSAEFGSTWGDLCLSVDIVSGRGKGQRRRIVKRDSTDTTKLFIDMPWTVKPDTSSRFQIAGVKWTFESGWYRWSESDTEVNRQVEVVFQPTAVDSLMDIELYKDHSETATVNDYSRAKGDNQNLAVIKGQSAAEITTTETDGHVSLRVPGHRETRSSGHRFVKVGMSGVTNGERHRLYQLEIRGAGT